MLIAETFESVQGEGPWAGTPSLFLRTSGCNLRCWFCDTPYTSWAPEGTQWSLDELTERVGASPASHVVVTGGEPMLPEDIVQLTRRIRSLDRTITIETAGTIDREVECDLMSISPKMKNSVPNDPAWRDRHNRERHQPNVIRSLVNRYSAILKFVVDQTEDIAEIKEYLLEFPEIPPDRIWLMPQARTREQLSEKSDWVSRSAEENGFRYSSRLHIERFGNQRGT
ncbi:MAG: 7-carboxy-7-deazaguanine synthase QueE [Planctomyces sp.]|jgi:7-carboxy-7-deazaguanine synthase